VNTEGSTLDRYELNHVLGTGSFATVWHAHDPTLGTDVAIKVLADNWARDPEMRQRFLTEGRHALNITSPRLVRVHAVQETDDHTPYLVMALADRGSLETRIDRTGPYELQDALRLGEQLALAVADLHEHGLLHRDLKPGNVLFSSTPDGGEQLMLGDFGMARALDRSALTLVGGTAAYSAPEQAAGLTQLGVTADLYPLGLIVTEALTGQLPGTASTMADAARSNIDIRQHCTDHGVEVPERVIDLLQELVSPEPEERPTGATEVAGRFSALLEDPGPVVESVGEHSESRWRIAALGVVAIALVIGGFLLTDGRDGSSQNAVTEDGIESTSGPLSEAEANGGAVATADVVPLPDGAVLDTGASRGDSVVANVAGDLDSTADFYRTLDGWTVEEIELSEGAVLLGLDNGVGAWEVELMALTLTTGADVTNIRIGPG
jgi:serine/threonine protein kinase